MAKHIKFKTTLYDTNWLTEHYVTKKLNTVDISEMLDCHPTTVHKALREAGIPVRDRVERHREPETPQGARKMYPDTLGDEGWLRRNWLDCFSFGELARRAGSSKVAVRNRMEPIFKKYPSIPQKAPEGLAPQKPYQDTVLNDHWLRATWLELLNVSHVAARAGCSVGYVSTHLKKLREREPQLPRPLTTGEKTLARKAGTL